MTDPVLSLTDARLSLDGNAGRVDILHGITRAAVLRFAREAQMEVEERSFTIDEAIEADEAFITSASSFVTPVVEIDGAVLGDGSPGRVATRLREIYLDESIKAAV